MPRLDDQGVVAFEDDKPEAPKPPKAQKPQDNLAQGSPLGEREAGDTTPNLEFPLPTKIGRIDPARRIRSFSPKVQQVLPATTGFLTGSAPGSDAEVASIGEALGGAVAYIDQQDILGGVPGALSAMRSRALDIDDPVLQDQALDFINALQDLPLEEQEAFIALQLGQNNPEGLEAAQQAIERIGATASTGEVQTSADSGGPVTRTGVSPSVSEEGLILGGEDVSISFKTMLKQMFPQLAVRIGSDLDSWEGVDDFFLTPADPNAVAQYVYDRSAGVRSVTDIYSDINTGKRGVLDSALPAIASGATVGFDVTTAAAGSGLRVVGAEGIASDIGAQATKASEAISEVFTAWAEEGFRVQTYGGHGVQFADTIDPSDPDYDWKMQQRMGAFAALTIGLGGTLGPAIGRRIKIVRGAVGRTGATSALRAVESTGRFAKRQGLIGTLAEVYKLPARVLIQKLDEQLVKLARDPEQFWKSGFRTQQGKRIIRDFEAAKAAHPGDINGQLGFITEVYGTSTFSTKLARAMLEQTTPEGMKRAFVDFLTNTPGKMAYSALRDSHKMLKKRLAKLETNIKGVVGKGRVAKLDLSPDEVKGLKGVAQYPSRTVVDETGAMRGRTPEQIEALRTSLRERGYDPNYVPEGSITGEPIGPLVVTYDPTTGKAIMLEGHHRLGLLAEEGLGAPIEVRINRGLEGAEAELAELGGAGLPEQEFKSLPPELQKKIADSVRDSTGMGADPERALFEQTRLELDQVEWRLKTTQNGLPMLRYPKRNMVRAAMRSPVTRAERFMHFASFNGIFTKLADELPRFPELFVTGSHRFPADGLERNIDTISKYLRGVGVDSKTVQRRIGELTQLRSPRAFYKLVEEKIFGKGGDVDRALSGRKIQVSPEVRERLINLHDSPVEGRTRSLLHSDATSPYGTRRVSTPVLGREVRPGEFTPVPGRPSEFLQTLRLPDVDLIDSANSAIRRLAGKVRNGSLKGKLAVSAVYDLPKALLETSTAILKPLVMLVRLPAMAMRIQMEQALRISSMGYRPFRGIPNGISLLPGGIPIPFTQSRVLKGLFGEEGWNLLAPDPRYKGFMEPDASETGMFMNELMDGGSSQTTPQSTLDFRSGRRTPKRQDYEAWRTELAEAHGDFLDSQIVRMGLDRDRVVAWLGSDERAARYLAMDQKPELDALGVTVEAWIDRRIEYLKQLTGENPELLRTIATGKLRTYEGIRPRQFGNRPVRDVYNELVQKRDLITADIRYRNHKGYPEGEGRGYSAEANVSEMAALQVERLRTLRKMDAVRAAYPDIDIVEFSTASLMDKRAARASLKKRWEAAEWEMPETLSIDQRLKESRGDTGIFDEIHQFNSSVSAALYKPFKALSWVDRKGTRGSLFAQAYHRRYAELVDLGYSPSEATAFARVHAAEITKDIMYDLSARTSVQRSLRHMFWFAPAWQEVLYTWLVKIPSASYWPIGVAGLATKYVLVKKALQEIGVLQKNSEGEDIIVIPGLATAIEKLTGLKVPEVTYGKLSGLNLVTTGGGVPGLSTAANFALGKSALKWGGPFKALSDMFQPYGPEASVVPTPITYLWETAFGEPAPWEFLSPELQKSRWDQTFDTGLQYAFAEMKGAGVTPPKPEDFGTRQDDGTWKLSAAQEAAYLKASEDYLNQLMAEGERYARGMAAVKLLGGTVAPMSLYTTTTDREEWKAFFDSIIPEEGFGEGGLTDTQKELIDDYLEDHPESTAFSVFQSEYGPKQRDLPFGESLDDKFFDDYYTGERQVTAPRDFSLKLMAIESLRHYQSRTDKLLDEISPSRDPWVLLTHGFERTDAIQEQKEAWDRYLFLNPEADAVLTRQRALWLKVKGGEPGVPVRSFEAERLGNTLDSLKQMSDQITGEAPIRPEFLRTTLANLQADYSEEGEFGKPNTPTEKAMSWWFDNVLEPYLDHTEKLYQAAQEAESLGLSPAPYYNQIRAYQNGLAPQYKGQSVPQVEEVFFGNKPPQEQKATILKWRTRPLSWASNFQLEKLGITDPTTIDFLNDVSEYDEQFWEYIRTEAVSPSSEEYDRLQSLRERTLLAEAQKRGEGSVEALTLNEAAPYSRLNAAGYGADNTYWGSATGAAGQIADILEANDLSPKGFSEEALQYKGNLYVAIEQARDADEQFNELWTRLSDIMLLPNGVPREGALLYEAVLFSNFNDQVPYALASIGGS